MTAEDASSGGALRRLRSEHPGGSNPWINSPGQLDLAVSRVVNHPGVDKKNEELVGLIRALRGRSS